MAVNTTDKLAAYRARAAAGDSTLLDELLAEVEYLTDLVTRVHYADRLYRYQALDGIRDDMCPCCRGRVVVDESDPARVRIVSVPYERAS